MSTYSNVASNASCDILVIGGGPAGSTVSTILSERGHKVVLVEKDKHPRFHIGESLLPMNLPLFDKLGVGEEIAKIGMLKPGAEFVMSNNGQRSLFRFNDAMDTEIGFAYQVRRSEFDHILLRRAVAAGTNVIENCRAVSVNFLSNGDVATLTRTEDGRECTWLSKFIVDASGRDTLLAKQFGIKRRNRDHNTAAMYSHFQGAQLLTGEEAGYITVFFFDYGWFWFIPLADGTTSVGAVCHPKYMKSRKGDLASFFAQTIDLVPELRRRLKDAEMTMMPIGTGNYVYRADRMGGDRYVLLGDAFAFVDPIFSTGVYMAMTSAFLGADVIEACLREPRKTTKVMRKFESTMRHGIDIFCWYIYRITTPALRKLLLGPKNYFHMEEAVLAVLAGNVFQATRTRIPLLMFKAIYYVSSLFSIRESLFAHRLRRDAVKVIDDLT